METSHSKWWNQEDEVDAVNAFTKGVKIRMRKEVYDSMIGWCRAADCEVSGLGLVRQIGHEFLIYDIWLPLQEGSGSTTELDQGSIAWIMQECHKRGSPLADLRFWWHTHYNFNSFFSGTDVDTCEKLVGSSAEWTVAVVINQKGEYKTRIDIMKPFRIALEDVPLEIDQPAEAVADIYKQQVGEQVKKRTYAVTYGSWWDKDKKEKKGHRHDPDNWREWEFGNEADEKDYKYGTYVKDEETGLWEWRSFKDMVHADGKKVKRGSEEGERTVNYGGKNIKVKDLPGYIKKNGGH